MGAWGFQAFDNDDALDWAEELEGSGVEVVRQGLTAVADGYVTAPDGSVAVAAAEITAAAQGNPHSDLPEDVATWVTAHGRELTAEDVQLALTAVERVGGAQSELAELWDEADEPGWKESLDNLSGRLRASLT